jgi:hypothetical protein
MASILNATTSSGLVTSADNSGSLQLATNNGTTAVTIDTSQNVGIGTAIPSSYDSSSKLAVVSATSTSVTIGSGSTGLGQLLFANGTSGVGPYNGLLRYDHNNNAMSFFTNGGTERMRIDSNGQAMIGTTTVSGNARLSLVSNSTAANYATYITTGNTSGNGHYVYLTGSRSASSTTYAFIYGDDSSNRFWVAGNGGISNFQANDGNLSDRREKTNFAPSKSYLDVICSIPVQTFNYIDQNLEEDDGLTLGVVAQDVQAVAPELVMESNWGTEEKPKMRLSIYQTDLQYALMKAIQELNAKVDAQALEIQALKGVA